MNKLIGITLFLAVLYGALMASLLTNPDADILNNHHAMGKRLGLYGILALAAGVLILSGGIDLSIGSQVALYAVVFGKLTVEASWSWPAAFAAILGLGAVVGVFHGLLVTKLKLQPFMVTLCGLFIYRSLARVLAGGRPIHGVGQALTEVSAFFNNNELLGLSYYLVILIALALFTTVLLHASVYGRYVFALGSNEQATRYAGIATDRYRILAYVWCSMITAFFTFFYLADSPSVEPGVVGINKELLAIASAVLGGCTLRGGEGTVYGMVVGSLILVIINLMISSFSKLSDDLEGTLIGCILLAGVTVDEFLRRRQKT